MIVLHSFLSFLKTIHDPTMRQFNRSTIASYTTLFVLCWCCLCGDVAAFHQSKAPINTLEVTSISSINSQPVSTFAVVARKTAVATLAVLLTIGTPLAPAFAATTTSGTTSTSAVQVYLDQIPPTTISLQVSDLPFVGNLLSGTYTKVDTSNGNNNEVSPPSVVIKSPKDKVNFVKGATSGHIEIDLAGKVGLKTHLDIDVAADEAGVARVRVASDLIPTLPFKNLASSVSSSKGGKLSQWNVVTNMGNSESYYFNTKTGATQFEKPDKI